MSKMTTKASLYDAALRLENQAKELRRHHVSIMDIGECLVSLASCSNQVGDQINVAIEGGAATGLRRAAYRIVRGTTEGFGDEMKLLAAYRTACKRGLSHREIIAFLDPSEKPSTMRS